MVEGQEEELSAGNDKELFNEAFTDTPAKEESSEPVKQEAEGKQPRDEQGRFAPKAEGEPANEAKAEPVVQQQEQAPAKSQETEAIPPWRLREEAERARQAEERAAAAQRQLEEFQRQVRAMQMQIQQANQKPVEPPDIFQDPAAYTQHLQSQFEKQRQQDRLDMSLNIAARFHGREAFDKAFSAFENTVQTGDRALYQRVMASGDPGEAIIAWHKEQEILREVGNDPLAFKKKAFTEGLTAKENEQVLIDAIKQNPELLGKLIATAQEQAKANAKGPNPNNITKLPSLNRATAAAATDLDGGDMSDGDLLKSALRG